MTALGASLARSQPRRPELRTLSARSVLPLPAERNGADFPSESRSSSHIVSRSTTYVPAFPDAARRSSRHAGRAEQEGAATTIQSAYRGHRGRLTTAKLRRPADFSARLHTSWQPSGHAAGRARLESDSDSDSEPEHDASYAHTHRTSQRRTPPPASPALAASVARSPTGAMQAAQVGCPRSR